MGMKDLLPVWPSKLKINRNCSKEFKLHYWASITSLLIEDINGRFDLAFEIPEILSRSLKNTHTKKEIGIMLPLGLYPIWFCGWFSC